MMKTKLAPSHKHLAIWQQALLIFLGSLIIAVSAKIAIPFYPVPVTLQTLAVLLIGMLLGPYIGALTVTCYLIEGAIGLPVFSYAPTAMTAGYLYGFLPAAFLAGLLVQRGWSKSWLGTFAAALLADTIVFLMGLAVLRLFMHSWTQTLQLGLYPFILGDLLKIIFATVVVRTALAKRA